MRLKNRTLKYIVNRLYNKLNFKFFFMDGTSLCTQCKSDIKGAENKVIIGANTRLLNCTFFIKGNGNTIRIADNCVLDNVSFWISDDNNSISLGKNIMVGKRCEFAALEGTKISIGDDCLFSHDIRLRTSDSHSLLDINGNRINPAKDISLGNHCWIGMQCLFLKGSKIGNDCIVGARSMVSHQFGDNVVVAGQPANQLKDNVNWNIKRI